MFNAVKDAFKIEDLRRRIFYTIAMLALVRLGSVMPNPLLRADLVDSIFSQESSAMQLFNIMSGNAFQNMNLFALGIVPYINASIIMSLLAIAIPALEEIQKDGESGRKKIAQYTRWLTVVLALIQAFAITFSLRSGLISQVGRGWAMIVSVLAFTAGSAFIMWIGENITENGIGNGISLIIFANILSRVPAMITGLFSYNLPWWKLLLLVLAFVIIVAFTVMLSLAERRVPIQYAKRMQGRKQYGGNSTNLPIRVNMAGVIPIIFAVSLISFPSIITSFFTANPTGWWGKALNWISTSHPFGATLYALLIIAFTFFYAQIQFNPVEVADNMKKSGGFVPGIRPGRPTADYLKRVTKYITFIGAIGLAILATIPVLMQRFFGIANLSIGGSSLLIVVGVALETMKQIESQLVLRHHKGFLNR
ncbi:MAG: preprotein translocase subunit SecY [Firmicutes bacterium]|nr:preprotein translocase subunit SecY [Bacillota bacterium]